MADTILLNKEVYTMTESELPCLITYGEGMGGSHFSVALVANLFVQGSKILFLTAYPMAKENFLQQVGADHSKVVFVNSLSELQASMNAQVIILESGNETLFLEVVEVLPDLRERVVLIKNIEVFSDKLFDACLNLEKIILSGNIDACVAKKRIAKKHFNSIIAFNQPMSPLPITVPSLEKWTGYLSSGNKSGVVVIQENKLVL